MLYDIHCWKFNNSSHLTSLMSLSVLHLEQVCCVLAVELCLITVTWLACMMMEGGRGSRRWSGPGAWQTQHGGMSGYQFEHECRHVSFSSIHMKIHKVLGFVYQDGVHACCLFHIDSTYGAKTKQNEKKNKNKMQLLWLHPVGHPIKHKNVNCFWSPYGPSWEWKTKTPPKQWERKPCWGGC